MIAPVFPAVHDVRAAAAAFLGAAPSAIEPLASGAGGGSLHRVRHQGRDWVLRGFRPGLSPSRADAVARVQALAAVRGLPVPKPLRTASGDLITVVAGRVFGAAPFVTGRGFDYRSASDLLAAAAALADWHNRLADVPSPTEPGAVSDLRRPGAVRERMRAGAARHTSSEAFHWAGSVLEQPRLLTEFWRVQSVLVHGDFHGGNLIFATGAGATVLDLDNVDRAPWVFDLAYAVLMMCRERRGDFVLPSSRVRAFVTHYLRSRPTADRAALRFVVPAMALSQTPEPWLIETLPRDEADRLVDSQHTALRRIREQATSISAIVTACAEARPRGKT